MKKLQKILLISIIGVLVAGSVTAAMSTYWKTISDLIPRTDNQVDIGADGKGVKKIWTHDLHASSTITVAGKATIGPATHRAVIGDSSADQGMKITTSGSGFVVTLGDEDSGWAATFDDGAGGSTPVYFIDGSESMTIGNTYFNEGAIRDESANLLISSTGDVQLKMGDNAGSNEVQFLDIDDALVAAMDSDGNLGLGITPTYKFHIYEGASGATAHASGDSLVVEDDTHVGISIITPNNMTQYIMFGDPQDNNRGQISYNQSTDDFKVAVAGATRLHGYQDGDWAVAGQLMVGLEAEPAAGIQLKVTSPTIRIEDSNDTGDSATGYMEYYDATPTRLGYFGVASATTSDFTFQADSGNIRFIATDASDYIQFQTSGDVPEITTVGTCDLKITASGGDINFDDENLYTTGFYGYNDSTPNYPMDLRATATDEVILNVDGSSYDYTGTGAGTAYGLQFLRDLNAGDGNDPKNFTALYLGMAPKHTSADLSDSKTFIAIKNAFIDTATYLNSSSVTNKTLTKYGEWTNINDDATFSTTGTKWIQNNQSAFYARLDNDSTFTSTDTITNYLWTAGLNVLNDITPTLSSGSLTVQNHGVYIDVTGSAVGSSTNYGIRIYEVNNADTNYGIKLNSGVGGDSGDYAYYDDSGLANAIIIDTDSAKIKLGETNTDMEIYSDGDHANIDSTGDIKLTSGAGDATIVFNGLVIPSGTTPLPAEEGALFLDTDAGANGTLVMYSNGAWRTVTAF